MSFSAEVKENLNEIINFDKTILRAELMGYCMSGNIIKTSNGIEFITENEFNIEHFYKILFNLGIEYEAETRGKCYVAQMQEKEIKIILQNYEQIQAENQKNIIKGAFLGAGSVNNPEKNYHLEISFCKEKYADYMLHICKGFGINFRKLKVNDKVQLYLKEGEEISKFLALIGANRSVLKFEDVRVLKEMKNNVNRKVNCETANLNKTIDAALRQIDDIKLIKNKKKFEQLPQKLKEVANLRLENPDLSLKDLSELMDSQIRKIWCR